MEERERGNVMRMCVHVGKRKGECNEERCVCMCVERMIEGVPVFVCEGV